MLKSRCNSDTPAGTRSVRIAAKELQNAPRQKDTVDIWLRLAGDAFLPDAFPSGKLWTSSGFTRVAGFDREEFVPVADKIVSFFLFAAHITYANHIRRLLHAAEMHAG